MEVSELQAMTVFTYVVCCAAVWCGVVCVYIIMCELSHSGVLVHVCSS